jgi:8-oxo-dGTP pyrophosphatase MutT (NUDIX family)
VIRGERLVDDSPHVRVSLADVELPNQVRFTQYVFRMRRCAITVVLDDPGERVLLMLRHRFIIDRWVWELPGGYVDDGEDPAAAAAREMEEETGWRPRSVEHVLSCQPMIGNADYPQELYLARGAEQVGAPRVDGRIFVFDATDRQIDLDRRWGGHELPWASAPSDNWQRGLPLVWRPPSYNDRIPAQNSAFLIGGVPQVYAGENAKYRKGPGDASSAGLWTIDEVRQATSVTLSMNSLDRKPQPRAKPTFTLRIAAEGKPETRAALEKNFGYNVASIYPDLYGLAKYAADGITI